MGIIMSVGVSIANAVLLITNAEQIRKRTGDAVAAAKEAVTLRLRPILIDKCCHDRGIAYRWPSDMERAGDKSLRWGRAVIGGLLFFNTGSSHYSSFNFFMDSR